MKAFLFCGCRQLCDVFHIRADVVRQIKPGQIPAYGSLSALGAEVEFPARLGYRRNSGMRLLFGIHPGAAYADTDKSVCATVFQEPRWPMNLAIPFQRRPNR